MPHLRVRFATQQLEKQSKLWPVVGLLGPRQSGKTTLIQTFLGVDSIVSLDSLQYRTEATQSPSAFLSKLDFPVVVDEAQKAPEIFDEIKLRVDQKRIPGRYFLTGSSSFSAKIGIRESLTGRIGLVRLYPMTLAELHQKPVRSLDFSNPVGLTPRFSIDEVIRSTQAGGMPVPAFFRDQEQRDSYWTSWLDTSLMRDLARYYGRGYDPDFAYDLCIRIGKILAEGELPTLRHFKKPAAKTRKYLSTMEEIFLLTRINCHSEGTGKEVWLLMDSGLASHLMQSSLGEGATQSLIRHFLWNEWLSSSSFQGKRAERIYFKSAHGNPVDAILNGIPFKIVPSVHAATRQLKYEERAVLGAMKKLGSKFGYILGPVDSITLPPKKGGIGVLPWGIWS